jgi:hypothetical protein
VSAAADQHCPVRRQRRAAPLPTRVFTAFEEKPMRRTMQALAIAAALTAGGTALAAQDDAREIPLKDSTTLVIFKDGKMSMRDARGRPHAMKDGMRMETKDGQVIMMKDNEVWRKTSGERLREELYRGG